MAELTPCIGRPQSCIRHPAWPWPIPLASRKVIPVTPSDDYGIPGLVVSGELGQTNNDILRNPPQGILNYLKGATYFFSGSLVGAVAYAPTVDPGDNDDPVSASIPEDATGVQLGQTKTRTYPATTFTESGIPYTGYATIFEVATPTCGYSDYAVITGSAPVDPEADPLVYRTYLVTLTGSIGAPQPQVEGMELKWVLPITTSILVERFIGTPAGSPSDPRESVSIRDSEAVYWAFTDDTHGASTNWGPPGDPETTTVRGVYGA